MFILQYILLILFAKPFERAYCQANTIDCRGVRVIRVGNSQK